MTPPARTAVDAHRSIDPRIRQRRQEIERSRGRRRMRRIVVVVVALALVAGAVTVLHTRWFSARVITVTGTHPHTSDAAIVAAAGLDRHPPLIGLDPGTTAGRVEALPYIAAAKVHRHWPDGVEIQVTERVPVAQMAGPGASWSTLDGNGRTLQVRPGRAPGPVVLIVHTADGGVPPAPVGDTLPATASAGLAVSRTLPPAFAAQVVSVTEAPDQTVSLALTSGITVQMGTASDLPSKYEDVAAIVAHASLRGATTIDVTVPQSPTVSG